MTIPLSQISRALGLATTALWGCGTTTAHAPKNPPVATDAERCVPTATNDILERDHLMLTAAYYDRGYPRVQIDPPVIRGERACFMVHPGQRYRLASVHVFDRDQQPGDALGDPAALSAMFHPRPGDWFARNVAVSDLQRIRARYRDAGYYSVEADPETSIDDRRAQMSMEIPIRRGPITTIERVNVTGNQRVAEETIRKELLVKAGDRYHESRILETTERLKALGAFRDVAIRYDLLKGHDDRLAITVEVKEN